MTPEPFLLIATVLYILQMWILSRGLQFGRDHVSSGITPLVSVVVAARNEEHHLSDCLRSILDQTYPLDRFEVIIVDDNSTDRTAAICAEFVSGNSNVLSIRATEDHVLKGKTNALAQAIDRARGEVILITDADCVVPPTWIEQTAARYGSGVGLVGGLTLQDAHNPFEGMQSLDWAYILGIAASTAALGTPLGSIGNNLSFRKDAYDSVGGYRNLKFSVTEDYTLVQAIIKTRRWDFLYPIDEKLLVRSRPCPSFDALLKQKHRWGRGGLDMKLAGFLIMASSYVMHAFLLWHAIWFSLAATIAALMAKFIADYFFLHKILSRANKVSELKYFYWFQLYYGIYVLALPFIVFFGGKVNWKGRSY
jgi:cellulose synthase/poly-beta-1,6-N-acetylglucosamine synthase-like glycosyltransferase